MAVRNFAKCEVGRSVVGPADSPFDGFFSVPSCTHTLSRNMISVGNNDVSLFFRNSIRLKAGVMKDFH